MNGKLKQNVEVKAANKALASAMPLPKLICERYLLSPTVRSGRISEVFKATDGHCPGKVVAVKIFKFGLFKDAVVQEAFEREGRILTELQHASIIPLFDYGIEPTTQRPFLVLDWGGQRFDGQH
jgi:serine/threonine protein kinase